MTLANIPIIQKVIAFFISVLALFGINIGTNDTPEVNTTPVITAVNEAEIHTLEISLRGNITTGYDWYCEIEKDMTCEGDVVSLVSDEYQSDATGIDVVGSGGTHYFRFKAESEGSALITFTYLRPWEDSLPVEKHIISVTVDENLNISASEIVLE